MTTTIDFFLKETTLLRAINEVKPVPSWFKDRYFPSDRVTTTDQKKVAIEIYADNEQVAPWVHRTINGKLLERKGGQVKDYEPVPTSPMRITTIEDTLNATVNEAVVGAKSPEQRAKELYAKDVGELNRSIDRLEEIACADVITTGRLVQKGEGVDETIDYWSSFEDADKPYKKLAGTAVWDNAASNPIADLRVAQDWVMDKTGIKPNEATIGASAAQALLDNVKFREALDIKNYRSAEIDIREITYGVSYLGRIIELGLDLYSYKRSVKPNGVERELMPLKSVVLGSTAVPTTLAYAVVTVFDQKALANRSYATTRAPFTKVTEAGTYIGIKSSPLPIVHKPQGFYVLEVLS